MHMNYLAYERVGKNTDLGGSVDSLNHILRIIHVHFFKNMHLSEILVCN